MRHRSSIKQRPYIMVLQMTTLSNCPVRLYNQDLPVSTYLARDRVTTIKIYRSNDEVERARLGKNKAQTHKHIIE